jgi:hypothetical protein
MEEAVAVEEAREAGEAEERTDPEEQARCVTLHAGPLTPGAAPLAVCKDSKDAAAARTAIVTPTRLSFQSLSSAVFGKRHDSPAAVSQLLRRILELLLIRRNRGRGRGPV